MNKDDLFEVIKGTVKLVSLDQLIQQRTKKLVNFCLTYYTADDLVRFEDRKDHYVNEDYWYSEPTFPAGKKKILAKRYNTLVSEVHEIKKVRQLLIELAFEDYQDSDADSDADFEVDTITIRKT